MIDTALLGAIVVLLAAPHVSRFARRMAFKLKGRGVWPQ